MSDYVRLGGARITRELAKLSPAAQLLYFRLLTGNHRTLVCGLWPARRESLAADFGMKPRAFDVAFAELEMCGLARADWVAGVVFVPGVVLDDSPANQKVLKAWSKHLCRLPDCLLSREALAYLQTHLSGLRWFVEGQFRLTLDGVQSGPPENGTPNGSAYRNGNGIPESENQVEEPPGSVFRVPSSAAAAVPAREPSQRLPTNLEQALQVPIAGRAKLALERADLAMWLDCGRWPEVQEAAEAFCSAQGWLCKLGGIQDRGVQALLTLFAAGFTLEELKRAGAASKGDEYLAKGRKGLSSLTIEVVRRLLDTQQSEADFDVESWYVDRVGDVHTHPGKARIARMEDDAKAQARDPEEDQIPW